MKRTLLLASAASLAIVTPAAVQAQTQANSAVGLEEVVAQVLAHLQAKGLVLPPPEA